MEQPKVKKVGLVGMVGLIVGSVIGGGVFNLMSDMANVSSVGPVILSLLISGVGMALFIFSMENLSEHLEDLDAGVYNYPQAGFGRFVGFNSAFGYWVSILTTNVALGTLSMSALGHFFPTFGDGSNVASVLVASALLWGMHFIIMRGSHFATQVNNVVTFFKLVPLAIFILFVILNFDPAVFRLDFWGTGDGGAFDWQVVRPQLSGALISAVWVYLGIEGAVLYSARAKSKKIVNQANILSFVFITIIYILATVGTFGLLPRAEIAASSKPSMAAIMGGMTGTWGAELINIGVFISSVGCWFVCTMLSGEILHQGARDGLFPKTFTQENKHQAPTNGLLFSNLMVQVFFLSLLINKDAYRFMAVLASSTMLVPYFFISLSQVKLSYRWSGDKIDRQVVIGVLSTLYMGFCIYASGWDYILLTTLLFAPAILLYMYAERERGLPFFDNNYEKFGAIVIGVLAVLAIYLMFNGTIDVTTM